MAARNGFPAMGNMPHKRTEHAMKLKEAGEQILNRIENGKHVPHGYLPEVVKAMVAFAAKTMEESHLQDVMNAVVKLSADSYCRENQIKDMIRDAGKQQATQRVPAGSASYAKVAAATAQADGRTGPAGRERPTAEVEERTITIKMNDHRAATENRKSDARTLATKINAAIKETAVSQVEIGAAKALYTTGDIQIVAATKDEAERLRTDTRWT